MTRRIVYGVSLLSFTAGASIHSHDLNALKTLTRA